MSPGRSPLAEPDACPSGRTQFAATTGKAATFSQGTAARDTAERYLRDTVLFASVLFLVEIA